MSERIEVLKTLFSLPESEYKVGSKAAITKIKLAPSIARAHMLNNASNSDNVGLYLVSLSGDITCTRFWPIHSYPIQALHTYRALLLLQECPVVEDDTLCACYYAMQPKIDSTSRHYLESLRESGFSNVEERRLKILNKKINLTNFEKAFLQPLEKVDEPVDLEELESEIKLGNLVTEGGDITHCQAILFRKKLAAI